MFFCELLIFLPCGIKNIYSWPPTSAVNKNNRKVVTPCHKSRGSGESNWTPSLVLLGLRPSGTHTFGKNQLYACPISQSLWSTPDILVLLKLYDVRWHFLSAVCLLRRAVAELGLYSLSCMGEKWEMQCLHPTLLPALFKDFMLIGMWISINIYVR